MPKYELVKNNQLIYSFSLDHSDCLCMSEDYST